MKYPRGNPPAKYSYPFTSFSFVVFMGQDKRLAMVVTTEMAARGLDVPQLTHVVNYDLPTDGDHYVHRAGR